VEPTGYCQNCGAPLEPNVRFCGACGYPVAASPAAAPPSANQAEVPPPPWEVPPAQAAGSPAEPSSPPPPFAGTPPTYGGSPAAPPPGASYTPPKKKSRTGLLVLGGCLLILVLVGVLAVGGVLWYKLQEDGPSSDGSSSGGVAVATLPAQSGVAKGELLYSDDFSDPGSGWDIREADDASTVYQSGAYHITVNEIDWVAWGNPYSYFTDFVLDVDATQVSGPDDNDFGVLLRYVDVDNFYRFEISGDGYYSFDLMQDDEWITLIEWTETPVIRQGNSTNTITVVCDGDLFTFYVNGQYLNEYRDSTFTEGDIGLLAGTIEEAPVHIAFDNVRVYALP
jgi:hypothetical protein